jgi:two-component system sensor histidine kinase ChvG
MSTSLPKKGLPGFPRGLRRLRSLRVRAFFVVFIVAVLPLVLVLVVNENEEGADRRMLGNTAAAVREAKALVAADGVVDTAEALRIIAFRHHVRLRVIDNNGVVIDVDEEAGGGFFYAAGAIFFGPDGAPSLARFESSLPPVLQRQEVRLAKTMPQARCDLVADRRMLVCLSASAVSHGNDDFVVHSVESSRRAVRALYDLRYQLLKLLLVSLPAALLLAWWLGWRMVRPLEQLRRQVLQRAHDRNPEPIDVGRGDEFGDLGNSFNELLSRLTERKRANAELVADLAHEFKNPVAAIRAASEQLENSVDAQRATRLGVVIGDAARRLDALVSEFLLLARAEGGLEGDLREDVDVDALVTALVARARDDIRAADVDIKAVVGGSLTCSGVPLQLERAIGNLINNAVSFQNGCVDLSVAADGDDIVVVVADDGPGIPAKDLPHIFERFFTTRAGGVGAVDGGRRSSYGTGLGLAFARAVVEAHGGTLTASSKQAPQTGAMFTVRLPLGFAPRPRG